MAYPPTHQLLFLPKPVGGKLTQHEAERRFSKERRTGVSGTRAQVVWKERAECSWSSLWASSL